MSALTAGKQIRRLADGDNDYAPQKGSTVVYAGALVMLDASGYAKPGATATGCIGVGLAKTNGGKDRFDATGLADGAQNVEYEEGTFPFANSGGGDALAATDQPGIKVYIVDDQTVAKTDGTGTRSPAGRLHHVDAAGVWVTMGKLIGGQIKTP